MSQPLADVPGLISRRDIVSASAMAAPLMLLADVAQFARFASVYPKVKQ
jgi:hypothetical protein